MTLNESWLGLLQLLLTWTYLQIESEKSNEMILLMRWNEELRVIRVRSVEHKEIWCVDCIRRIVGSNIERSGQVGEARIKQRHLIRNFFRKKNGWRADTKKIEWDKEWAWREMLPDGGTNAQKWQRVRGFWLQRLNDNGGGGSRVFEVEISRIVIKCEVDLGVSSKRRWR